MKHILLVDDNVANLRVAHNLLNETYKVSLTKSGKQALEFCEKNIPDLILLDIHMPDMDGFETIQHLKANERTAKIPVIFLTATANNTDIEAKGFEYGGVDFIVKPFAKSIMLRRIDTHLQLSGHQQQLENKIRELEDGIVTSFSQLIECRDYETGGHVERTKKFVEILAHELADSGQFKEVLTDDYIEMLVRSAPLHDIGKIGISDLILSKPGRLTPEEFNKMKEHTVIGERVLLEMMERTGTQEYLKLAREVAVSDHERYDGNGYPDGLKGEDIPVSGRIMAIADVYDALISDRVYHKALPEDQACKIIIDGKGTQFDPIMIEAFERVRDEFYRVAQQIE